MTETRVHTEGAIRRIVEPAPAKINLTLHVLGRRTDGYHELESVVAFADVGETVTLEPAAKTSLTIEGPFARDLSCEDNLVRSAHRTVGSEVPAFAIHLNKEIPVSAGLGGGSADAAAALRALKRAECAQWSEARFGEISRTLGADVPVCIASRAAFMSGIGEKVTPVAPPPFHAILVNPGIQISTAEVFSALGLAPGEATERTAMAPTLESSAKVRESVLSGCNDLERPARHCAPVIDDVLAVISDSDGCVVARMSGSGATCFGLYDRTAEALAAAKRVRANRPDWWVRTAELF